MSADELHELSDEELLSEFVRTGEHRFLDELVRRYYARVLAGANVVLRDKGKAADVAQDTFVRVFTNAGQFNGGSFQAWIFTISKRLSLDQLARRRGGGRTEFPVRSSESDGLTRLAEVEQVLGRLSRPQRICLQLYYGEGLSYREIAQQTTYTEKAVKAHIQNGRKRFRRLWEKRAQGGGGE